MPTVLVVDDEPDILEILEVTLQNAGYRVITAGDGAEALDAVAREVPDVMLLDIGMPQLDGWQVLERLKSSAESDLSEVPVVMVTAWTSEEDQVRGGIEGAVRYLGKPFNPVDVVGVIDDLLGPDAPSEPEERRKVQRSSLERLARLEGGGTLQLDGPRVHLTRLDRPQAPATEAPSEVTQADLSELIASLSGRQRSVVERIVAGEPVADIATALGVSRSNIYAILRRVAKKAGTRDGRLLIRRLRRYGAAS